MKVFIKKTTRDPERQNSGFPDPEMVRKYKGMSENYRGPDGY